jgi:hypothetical protein
VQLYSGLRELERIRLIDGESAISGWMNASDANSLACLDARNQYKLEICVTVAASTPPAIPPEMIDTVGSVGDLPFCSAIVKIDTIVGL